MADRYNLSDVMISYSRTDKDFVEKLARAIKKTGRELWIDWQDIPPTVDWWEEIKAGIEASRTVVFIISPDSVHSEICQKEVAHAAESNKRIVPILRRDITKHEVLNVMHPALAAHNWVMFRDEDDQREAFRTLIRSLETDFNYVNQHTRFLVRANEWEAAGRPTSLLLRGNDLRGAEDWLGSAQQHAITPTQLQIEYITRSRGAAVRTTRMVTTIALITLVALGGLSLFANIQANQRVQESQARETAQAEGQIALEQASTAVAVRMDAEERATFAAHAVQTAESLQMTAEFGQGGAETAAARAIQAEATSQANQLTAEANLGTANANSGTASANAGTAAAAQATSAAGQGTASAEQATAAANASTANAAQATAAAGEATAAAGQGTASAQQLTAAAAEATAVAAGATQRARAEVEGTNAAISAATANYQATEAANQQNAASNSQTEAAHAQATSSAALAGAHAAQTQAANAQATANGAIGSANAALTEAANAQANANSAQATAESAQATAVAALTAAANAGSNASAAQTEAANALATAAAAQATAEAEKTLAALAEANANALLTQAAQAATEAHNAGLAASEAAASLVAIQNEATILQEQDKSRELIIAAEQARDRGDPKLALQLALLAVDRAGMQHPLNDTTLTRFFDLVDSVPLHRTITVADNLDLRSVDWSPDGACLVTGSGIPTGNPGGYNYGVHIWPILDTCPYSNMELLVEQGPGDGGVVDSVNDVDWSSDGQFIASADNSGWVNVWDVAEAVSWQARTHFPVLDPYQQDWPGPQSRVWDDVGDGNWTIPNLQEPSKTSAMSVRIIYVNHQPVLLAAGSSLGPNFTNYTYYIVDRFNSTSESWEVVYPSVSSLLDGYIDVYDIAPWVEHWVDIGNNQEYWYSEIAFVGESLTGFDSDILLYNLPENLTPTPGAIFYPQLQSTTRNGIVNSADWHGFVVNGPGYTYTEPVLASGTINGVVNVWGNRTYPSQSYEVGGIDSIFALQGHGGSVTSVAWAIEPWATDPYSLEESIYLASGSVDHTVRIWEGEWPVGESISSQYPTTKYIIRGNSGAINDIAWQPGQGEGVNRLVTVTSSGEIRIWDLGGSPRTETDRAAIGAWLCNHRQGRVLTAAEEGMYGVSTHACTASAWANADTAPLQADLIAPAYAPLAVAPVGVDGLTPDPVPTRTPTSAVPMTPTLQATIPASPTQISPVTLTPLLPTQTLTLAPTLTLPPPTATPTQTLAPSLTPSHTPTLLPTATQTSTPLPTAAYTLTPVPSLTPPPDVTAEPGAT